MKRLLFALLLVLPASPALATGGFVCRTAGSAPIELSVGFGHVPGSPLILTRLTDSGRQVPVQSAQWWLDNREMRLLLINPAAMREELVLRARRNGHAYDGSIVRNGRSRWVRCRED
jgi:hypothetical protein